MAKSEQDEDPRFFDTPDDFRQWLRRNHERASVLWVGYYKKASGLPSITWPESVDQALCFGWIDGLRRSIDEVCYKIRFTPRRPSSHWSAVNIQRVAELRNAGLMRPAGERAFENRRKERSKRASYEQREVELDPAYVRRFQRNPKAWAFFEQLAPYAKRASIWYVMSAKREETRLKRLQLLIDSSSQGRKIPPLDIGKKSR